MVEKITYFIQTQRQLIMRSRLLPLTLMRLHQCHWEVLIPGMRGAHSPGLPPALLPPLLRLGSLRCAQQGGLWSGLVSGQVRRGARRPCPRVARSRAACPARRRSRCGGPRARRPPSLPPFSLPPSLPPARGPLRAGGCGAGLGATCYLLRS